ncbi:MAG TPA: ribosome maturation factor RimM, partial [Fimbriimonadaceae bacterium]|nr:ribosome maturation factor RimM [Fimbriimonadaceae bacterium]
EYPRVGRIVGAFGLKGQVKVEPLTEFLARFEPGSVFRVGDRELALEQSQWHKGRLLLKLEGIDRVEDAEALQWAYLETQEEDMPPLEEDEYFTKDLIGMALVTHDGRALGYVDQVLPMPAHDVLVSGSLMIPAVKQFVKSVDLEQRRIVVELIEGMEEAS